MTPQEQIAHMGMIGIDAINGVRPAGSNIGGIHSLASARTEYLDIRADDASAGAKLASLHSALRVTMTAMRELVSLVEQSAIEHIEATGRDIDLANGSRWYIGRERKRKCRNDAAMLQSVLEAAGGDFSVLASGDSGVLAAAPWKWGAVKSLIGEARFAALVEETEVTDLKTGKVAKVLKATQPELRGGT